MVAAGSIHRAAWPAASEAGDPGPFEAASLLIGAVRRAKSAAGLSMRADCATIIVPVEAAAIRHAQTLGPDLTDASHVAELVFVTT